VGLRGFGVILNLGRRIRKGGFNPGKGGRTRKERGWFWGIFYMGVLRGIGNL